MKTLKLYLAILTTLLCVSAFAQVQIDHQLQFTGSGSNAEITGVKTVAGNQDATNVNVIQQGSLIYSADTSTTANTYAVPISPVLSGAAYTAGMVVNFKANLANTGTATLNVNNIGAVTILKNYNVALAANDIRAGQMVTVMYDGANFQMLSQLGNSSSGASGFTHLVDFEASGSWTAPAGVTTAMIEVWGGGGNGCTAQINSGGGGGGYGKGIYTVVPNMAYTVTVGSAGGGAGSTSSVGALISATGGAAAHCNGYSPIAGTGGTSSATVNVSGQNGINGSWNGQSGGIPAAGGQAGGGGGAGGIEGNGTVPGGGGGEGGSGASGRVIIWY